MTESRAGSRSCVPPIALAVAFVVNIAIAFWCYRWRVPLGISNEWRLPGVWLAPWPWQAWLFPVGLLLVLGGLILWSAYDRFRRAKSRREQKASMALAVASLSLLSMAWQWTLLGAIGMENLINATWSDVSNGYFGTAYQIQNPREFTGEYANRSQSPDSPLQAHVATHPPGAVLFYYAAIRLCEVSPPLQELSTALARNQTGGEIAELAEKAADIRNSAAASGAAPPPQQLPQSAVPAAVFCALSICILLGLAVPAVYLLGVASASTASIKGDGTDSETESTGEARGLIAAGLFALAPAAGLFAFTLDALVTFGAAWTLALAALALARRKTYLMALAGIALGLTTYVSFGATATGVIVALGILMWEWRQSAGRPASALRPAVTQLLTFAAGFIALWLVLTILLPMQPLSIFSKAMAAHHVATLSSRSHGKWLLMNPVMFSIFCGGSMVILVLATVWRSASCWRQESSAGMNITAIIGLATLLTLLVLDVSGNVRGEVERLWLFMVAPLAAMAATLFVSVPPRAATKELSKLNRREWFTWLGMMAMQALQTLIMASTLAPLVRPA